MRFHASVKRRLVGAVKGGGLCTMERGEQKTMTNIRISKKSFQEV